MGIYASLRNLSFTQKSFRVESKVSEGGFYLTAKDFFCEADKTLVKHMFQVFLCGIREIESFYPLNVRLIEK